MDIGDVIFSKTKPSSCPACGSSRVAEIVYGMPSPEMYDAPDFRERYVTGGCLVSDVDPAWRCLECDTSIYPEDARTVLEDMEPPF